MSIEEENFVVALFEEAKTHEAWLELVRFGRATLLENQRLFAEIIVMECMREASKTANHKPSDEVGMILGELKLKLAPI